MAGEVLKSADGLLAGFPDNVSGQISPVDVRNFVISAVSGIGAFDDVTNYVAPMVDGVPTVMNPLMTPVDFAANFFQLDGNNAFIPDYGSAVINPGTLRLVDLLFLIVADQVGSPSSDTYFVQARVGGVPINSPQPTVVDTANERFFLNTEFLYDVQLGLPIDVTITPTAVNADLDISFGYMRVSSQLI